MLEIGKYINKEAQEIIMGINNLDNGLNRVQDLFNNAVTSVKSFIKTRPIAAASISSGVGLALGGVVGAAITKRKKRTSKSRSSRKRNSRRGSRKKRKSNRSRSRSRSRSRDYKYLSKQKHEQRYKSKRKRPYKVYKSKKSRRGGVKYTKNGQPYIILSSGKARFIKGKRRK